MSVSVKKDERLQRKAPHARVEAVWGEGNKNKKEKCEWAWPWKCTPYHVLTDRQSVGTPTLSATEPEIHPCYRQATLPRDEAADPPVNLERL